MSYFIMISKLCTTEIFWLFLTMQKQKKRQLLLEENLKDGEKFDRIMAVGCTFMMYRVGQITRPFNVKTIVSMNPIMIDGTGMCGACRLSIGGETKFACVDGPHFDAHEVDWDVVLARRKAYLEEEIISKER